MSLKLLDNFFHSLYSNAAAGDGSSWKTQDSGNGGIHVRFKHAVGELLDCVRTRYGQGRGKVR